MPPVNPDDLNVYIALGAIASLFALAIGFRIYWSVSGHVVWATRVRELLASEGFRVRHMERRWFTRGPFADMKPPGTKGHREWLVRVVAEDGNDQPRAGWLRWRRRFPWEAADRWAVRWDDVPWSGQWDGASDPQRKGLPTPVFLLLLVGAAVIALLLTLLASRASAADDVLARSRAVYASLKSYADTGTVDYDYGPSAAPVRERYSFKTSYRAPRHFLFDFTKGTPGGRFVVWGDGEVFHTWWSTTGVHDTYPRGRGATAFVISTQPTAGSSVMLAPLLFQGAGLIGTLEELAETNVEGTEMIGDRKCHRIAGVARSRYGSGNETHVRRTVVWIDVETLLVRRVFEDTPRGTPAANISRITTIFDPQANPPLEDGRFRFTVPAAPR